MYMYIKKIIIDRLIQKFCICEFIWLDLLVLAKKEYCNQQDPYYDPKDQCFVPITIHPEVNLSHMISCRYCYILRGENWAFSTLVILTQSSQNNNSLGLAAYVSNSIGQAHIDQAAPDISHHNPSHIPPQICPVS